VEEWKEGQIRLAFKVERGFGLNGKGDGFCYKNVLSPYMHIHALGERRWVSTWQEKLNRTNWKKPFIAVVLLCFM